MALLFLLRSGNDASLKGVVAHLCMAILSALLSHLSQDCNHLVDYAIPDRQILIIYDSKIILSYRYLYLYIVFSNFKVLGLVFL